MQTLRYSINVTLDGCCDHRAISADEDLHRHATENLDQADALLFGRVTYEMMEAAWRPPAQTGASIMRVKSKSPNKAGAGNGARALSFHIGRLGRAVPDLSRSPFSRLPVQQRVDNVSS